MPEIPSSGLNEKLRSESSPETFESRRPGHQLNKRNQRNQQTSLRKDAATHPHGCGSKPSRAPIAASLELPVVADTVEALSSLPSVPKFEPKSLQSTHKLAADSAASSPKHHSNRDFNDEKQVKTLHSVTHSPNGLVLMPHDVIARIATFLSVCEQIKHKGLFANKNSIFSSGCIVNSQENLRKHEPGRLNTSFETESSEYDEDSDDLSYETSECEPESVLFDSESETDYRGADFTLNDDVSIPSSCFNKNFGHEQLINLAGAAGCLRSIDGNDFDCLHLKNGSPKKRSHNYNHRIPLFLGTTDPDIGFFCMKCKLKHNQECIAWDYENFEHLVATHTSRQTNGSLRYFDPSLDTLDPDECEMLSFFIEDHDEYGNVVIVINAHRQYSVYSIDTDRWLLNRPNGRTFGFGAMMSDGLLFDKELLVIDSYSTIYFYDLSNLLIPRYIGHYDIPESRHGQVSMACVEKKERIKIWFYGGYRPFEDFIKSFWCLDFNGNYRETMTGLIGGHQQDQELSGVFDIVSYDLEFSGNFDHPPIDRYKMGKYDFRHTSIVNAKDERILCILNRYSRMFLFNCQTKNFIVENIPTTKDLEFDNPWLISHVDHVHVIEQYPYPCQKVINLRRLLQNSGGYKEFCSWEQERIIWIGFEKNTGNEDCMFGRKGMSKDVVNHLLSFLR